MPIPFFLESSTTPLLRFGVPETGGTFGRSSGCSFVVNDATISRKHAEIRVCDTEWIVKDFGSRNGTFLNDRRVETCRLVSGNVVRFGRVSFIIKNEDIEDETDSWGYEPSGNRSAILPTPQDLSKAQRRVFELVISGISDKGIAHRLDLSPHTVHNHMRTIFRIFDVHSRAQLLALVLGANGSKPFDG